MGNYCLLLFLESNIVWIWIAFKDYVVNLHKLIIQRGVNQILSSNLGLRPNLILVHAN